MPRTHYDVLIAGARCAGASTAMLLARQGLRVLMVDPLKRGSDTLSTHALMRGAVLQLHRWGLLESVRAAGTPAIRTTTFHYGSDEVEVPIEPKDGVDALYAPRRTVLDPILGDAAVAAGAEFLQGVSLVDLARDPSGRVTGVRIADAEKNVTEVKTDLVIGADGRHSRVARLLGAPVDYVAPHAASSLYGYWSGLPNDGNHWYFEPGASVGYIPTNEGETCVFALVPSARFETDRAGGLQALHREALTDVSPELADRVGSGRLVGRLRAFAGMAGFLRRCTGPGWALVGDAAYFKDPITAHGITDALLEAELLARAVGCADQDALRAYREDRDERVRALMDITDRIASLEWDLDEVQRLHRALSREMKAEVEVVLALGGERAAADQAGRGSSAPAAS